MAMTDRECALVLARLDKLEEKQDDVMHRLVALESSQKTLKWVIGLSVPFLVIGVEIGAWIIFRTGG